MSGGLSQFLREHGQGWLFFIAIGWIGCLFFIFLILGMLKQIVFSHRRAIWADDTNIFFLTKFFMAVRKDAIINVSSGNIGRHARGIILHLRDGTTKSIPTAALSDPEDVVVGRLRKALQRRQ